MKKRYIVFRAAGKTVRFVARSGQKAARYGATKGRSWATKQKSKAVYAPYHAPQKHHVKSRTRVVKPQKSSSRGMVMARCPICHNLQMVRKGQANTWIARHVKAVHGR